MRCARRITAMVELAGWPSTPSPWSRLGAQSPRMPGSPHRQGRPSRVPRGTERRSGSVQDGGRPAIRATAQSRLQALRRQMRSLIDRSRWPVLVTYSDEGQGHTGHVYRCSGWHPTMREVRQTYTDEGGRRASSYSGGQNRYSELDPWGADSAPALGALGVSGAVWLRPWRPVDGSGSRSQGSAGEAATRRSGGSGETLTSCPFW